MSDIESIVDNKFLTRPDLTSFSLTVAALFKRSIEIAKLLIMPVFEFKCDTIGCDIIIWNVQLDSN